MWMTSFDFHLNSCSVLALLDAIHCQKYFLDISVFSLISENVVVFVLKFVM